MTGGGGGEQPAPRPVPVPRRPDPLAGEGSVRPRVLVGSVLAVVGVLLGIGSLLLVTDDPSQRLGPVVATQPPPPVESSLPETEAAPVEPPSAATALPAVPAPLPDPGSGGPSPSRVAPGQDPTAAGAVERQAPGPAASRRPLVVPITVLNNSRRSGLAERAAARFERGGWPVALTGNYRGQIPATTVYYDPGMEASARAFAASFEGIVRVLPRFSGLPARGVVVVLTKDFAA